MDNDNVNLVFPHAELLINISSDDDDDDDAKSTVLKFSNESHY